MAMISPYGDPNAHGPLNNSLCFQRYKNKVFLRAFPRPVPRYTGPSLLQRQKLTDAAKAYNLLTGASKYFYRKRAGQKMKTSRNLFMSAHMKKYLPSINTPIPARSIENIVIFNPAGLYLDEIEISIVNQFDFPAYMFWNPCNTKINNELVSNYGPNGIIEGGIDLVPGKFDQAIVQSNDTGVVRFPHSIFDFDQGYLCYWIKTNFNVIDGYAQDRTTITPITAFGLYLGRFMSYFYPLVPDSQMAFYRDAVLHALGGNTNLNWTSGTWTHFVYAWDKLKSLGWSSAVFMNGQLINSKIGTLFNFPLGDNTFNLLFSFGLGSYHWGDIILDDVIVSKSLDNLSSTLTSYESPGCSPSKEYGRIYDHENVYYKIDEVIDYGIQKIIISTPAGHPAHIPFRYLLGVEWKDQEGEVFNSVIRLPELTLGALETVELFLSRDWSVYWDKDFHRLACTNQL